MASQNHNIHVDVPTKLKLRARLLTKIRQFFLERNVLEVETPLLCPSTIPSPNIHSFTTQYYPAGTVTAAGSAAQQKQQENGTTLYLQTSPEFAMKRLLAQHSGDIYQICKAFRNEEYGRLHNPEFTLLEWYRVGYDHHQLMDEMDELLQFIFGVTDVAERFSYAALFAKYLELDPHASSVVTLKQCARQHAVNADDAENDKDYWLQLLLTHVIEPQLKQKECPIFIYDFPASQAALAQIRNEPDGGPPLASRFELYFKGVELANGFHELRDADEQRRRFEEEQAARRAGGMSCPPLDEKFLQALPRMPSCAGVALGIDRLLMAAAAINNIGDVLSFSIETM